MVSMLKPSLLIFLEENQVLVAWVKSLVKQLNVSAVSMVMKPVGNIRFDSYALAGCKRNPSCR